jgi:hypothetical protein
MNDLRDTKNAETVPTSVAGNSKPETSNDPDQPVVELILSGEKHDRAYFAKRIEKATLTFYRSAQAVSEILLQAKVTLSPEEFIKFINEDVQLDYTVVCKFVKMAANFRLNDPANKLWLPTSWTLRYEIMNMEETTFRAGIQAGVITPDCKLADLVQLRERLEGKKTKKGGKGKGDSETANASKSEAASAGPSEKNPSQETAARTAPKDTASIPPLPKKTVMAETSADRIADKSSRIVLVLSPEIIERNKAEVVALKTDLLQLVAKYPFLGGVDFPEKAIALAA